MAPHSFQDQNEFCGLAERDKVNCTSLAGTLNDLVNQSWNELQKYTEGDTEALLRVTALMYNNAAVLLRPPSSYLTDPAARTTVTTLAPQLLIRTLESLQTITNPSMILLVSMLNAKFTAGIVSKSVAQPLQARPTDLEALCAIYAEAIATLHTQHSPAMEKSLEVVERQLLRCVAVVEVLLRDHHALVSSLESVVRGVCSMAEKDSGWFCLRWIYLWDAVVDALHDHRIPFGGIRRAQHCRALESQTAVLLECIETLLATPGSVQEHCRTACAVLTKTLQWTGQGRVCTPGEELGASTSEIFCALSRSSIWQWAVLCVASSEPAWGSSMDVDLSTELLCAVLRLCSSVNSGTYRLLSTGLEVAVHLGSGEAGFAGLCRCSQLVEAVATGAGPEIFLGVEAADTEGLRSNPGLAVLLSNACQGVLKVLQTHTSSICVADRPLWWEAMRCSCEAVNALAEALLPDLLPTMEATDDPEDFEFMLNEISAANSEKMEAMRRLEPYFCWCRDALAAKLENAVSARSESSMHHGELIEEWEEGLTSIAEAILEHQDLFQVGFENLLVGMWVTYERVFQVLNAPLPDSLLVSSEGGGKLLPRIPSAAALVAYLTQHLPAILQSSDGSLRVSELSALKIEAPLLPAAVSRVLEDCSFTASPLDVQRSWIHSIVESLNEVLRLSLCESTTTSGLISALVRSFALLHECCSSLALGMEVSEEVWRAVVDQLIIASGERLGGGADGQGCFSHAVDLAQSLFDMALRTPQIFPPLQLVMERLRGASPAIMRLGMMVALETPGVDAVRWRLETLSETVTAFHLTESSTSLSHLPRAKKFLNRVVARLASQILALIQAETGERRAGAVEEWYHALSQWLHHHRQQGHELGIELSIVLTESLPEVSESFPVRGKWLLEALPLLVQDMGALLFHSFPHREALLDLWERVASVRSMETVAFAIGMLRSDQLHHWCSLSLNSLLSSVVAYLTTCLTAHPPLPSNVLQQILVSAVRIGVALYELLPLSFLLPSEDLLRELPRWETQGNAEVGTTENWWGESGDFSILHMLARLLIRGMNVWRWYQVNKVSADEDTGTDRPFERDTGVHNCLWLGRLAACIRPLYVSGARAGVDVEALLREEISALSQEHSATLNWDVKWISSLSRPGLDIHQRCDLVQ